ncbi:GGDEF domain-containing protein [Desulfovibrio sp. OttesenSCG-928-C06]|nr:GGDEF domain-containing protein [Desulfovibrio sp. OttesenSCG-928-C06]
MLLLTAREPLVPDEFKDDEAFMSAHAHMVELRNVLTRFSRGELEVEIDKRGFVFGSLKALQANLRHLIWQVNQVADNDLTQRMDFLGDLSSSFNSMVRNVNLARLELEEKHRELTALTKELREEIQKRSATLRALRASESRFRYLAEHDALTGAMNRRSFLNTAEIEMQKSAYAELPCAIAILDVDYFKNFNDTNGHMAGDMALKHLVSVARKVLRSADFMGRYGGEEFVFFFADANEKAAMRAAERIRASIEEQPLEYKGKTLGLTASIGVCVVKPEWPGERDQGYLMSIMDNADSALYEAKKTGRNRAFLVALEPPPVQGASYNDTDSE